MPTIFDRQLDYDVHFRDDEDSTAVTDEDPNPGVDTGIFFPRGHCLVDTEAIIQGLENIRHSQQSQRSRASQQSQRIRASQQTQYSEGHVIQVRTYSQQSNEDQLSQGLAALDMNEDDQEDDLEPPRLPYPPTDLWLRVSPSLCPLALQYSLSSSNSQPRRHLHSAESWRCEFTSGTASRVGSR